MMVSGRFLGDQLGHQKLIRRRSSGGQAFAAGQKAGGAGSPVGEARKLVVAEGESLCTVFLEGERTSDRQLVAIDSMRSHAACYLLWLGDRLEFSSSKGSFFERLFD